MHKTKQIKQKYFHEGRQQNGQHNIKPCQNDTGKQPLLLLTSVKHCHFVIKTIKTQVTFA
jgi:hypothetical protein